MAKKSKSQSSSNQIAENRKARFEYHLEDSIETGIVLEGWEVKSLRAGKANIADAYVIVKNGEAWLLGALITPLVSASTHIKPDQQRTRKLLLHRKELNNLIGAVERKGYTLVPVKMYWKEGRAKLLISIAKGKQTHDKRQSIKEREWQRDKNRLLKKS